MNNKIKITIAVLVLLISQVAFSADRYQPEIPNEIVAQFVQARDDRRNGNLDQSISAFKKIIASFGDYYLANYNLALALTDAKKYSEAKEYYLKAIEISKKKNIQDYSIFNSFGWMYLISGNFIDAEKQFDVAIANINKMATEDGKRKTYNNAGLNYIYLGKYAEAERVLKIAVVKYSSESAVSNLNLLSDIKSRKDK